VEVDKYIGREGALRKKVRRCRCAAVDFDLLLSLCRSVPSLRTVFYIFTILNILITLSRYASLDRLGAYRPHGCSTFACGS
jgi:hypothetical protein